MSAPQVFGIGRSVAPASLPATTEIRKNEYI